MAGTDAAYAGLWRFLLTLDLVGTVRASELSVDEPLWWMIDNKRAARITSRDHHYLRVLDVPATLAARSYDVEDVIAVGTGGTATGDIGAFGTINQVQGIAYLAGGLLFGIALYRAHVLARWAAVLLAVGGVVSAALSVMPDAFYRLLAYPNGIAMIGLGYSLWSTARRDVSTQPAKARDRRATTTGGEATA